MRHILPVVPDHAKLHRDAIAAASSPPSQDPPIQPCYFVAPRSVRIGSYFGKLEYFWPRYEELSAPMLACVVVDPKQQRKRGAFQKCIDKLFLDLDFDGRGLLSATELRAFWSIEEWYASAVHAYRKVTDKEAPHDPQHAVDAINTMLAWMRCMANWPHRGVTIVARAAEEARRAARRAGPSPIAPVRAYPSASAQIELAQAKA